MRGDTADVVERQASVQSFLDPILVVYILQSLGQRSAQVQQEEQERLGFVTPCFVRPVVLNLGGGRKMIWRGGGGGIQILDQIGISVFSPC